MPLVLVVVGLGCSSSAEKKPEPPRDKPPQAGSPGGPGGGPNAPGGPNGPGAPNGPQESVSVRQPGSTRAVIYTWREKFPLEVQVTDETWFLKETTYTKTPDHANAWQIVYCTKKGDHEVNAAAIEYASTNLAQEKFADIANVLSKSEGASTLAIKGADAALAARLPKAGVVHGIAAARSGPFVILFDRVDGPLAPELAEKITATLLADDAPITSR